MHHSNGSLETLSGPTFPGMRSVLGQYLIDKTELIARILSQGMSQQADLILRPRRCGKSCMLRMIWYVDFN
jgi:hypothetical protein